MTLKELRERQARVMADARARLNEITPETDAARVAELESQHDAAMSEYDRLEARAQREERLAEVEARHAGAANVLRRPNDDRDSGAEERNQQAVDQSAIFVRAMQFGPEALSDTERRSLAELRAQLTPEMRAQATSTTAGGYTIPQGFLPELTKSLIARGPMLDDTKFRVIRTDSGNPLLWPTVNDTANTGADHTENTAETDQDVTFGQKQLDAYVFTSGLARVSLELLQDSAFDFQELLRDLFGDRLGDRANTKLTTGTGSNQPNGIVTASTLGKTAASVSAIAADELIEFYHSINPAYRASPKFAFMFNDTTLLAIRKLKDGQNNYLVGGLNNDQGTLQLAGMRVPYVINQAMASPATGAKVIVGGDFNKYIVRQVRDFSMMRLNERFAEALQVGFLAFNRIDGELADTAAVKHYKMA